MVFFPIMSIVDYKIKLILDFCLQIYIIIIILPKKIIQVEKWLVSKNACHEHTIGDFSRNRRLLLIQSSLECIG